MVKIPPPNAKGSGLIPGPGTKIPHAVGCSQKLNLKKKKERKKEKKSVLFKILNIYSELRLSLNLFSSGFVFWDMPLC